MTAPLLDAQGLRISFGGVVAADGVNLAIAEGEHVAIIGPNGAGKTTFLNICTGYLRPTGGSVRFAGHEITAHSPRRITRLGIARAFQIPQLFAEHTALENLLIAASARDSGWLTLRRLGQIRQRDEMMNLLELIGCGGMAERPIGELPEGTRKLIDIALALALKPKLLLLDEPTSGVASSEKFEIMDILHAALSKQKVTSVFVEHDMGVVERYADRIAVWSSGRIAKDGPPAEVLKDPEVLREVIGV